MSKKEFYEGVLKSVESVLSKERNFVTNSANLSAIMYHEMNTFNSNSINWFGFYFVDKKKPKELILGPFQGKVACTRIKFSRGVCGFCATNQKSVVVPDVHKFEGHIACDSASNSEGRSLIFNFSVCIPIFDKKKEFYGLIDVDSVNFENFDKEDVQYLEELARIFEKSTDLE